MTKNRGQHGTGSIGSAGVGLPGLVEAMGTWVLPAALLLVLATVAAYSDSLGGPMIFDDCAGIRDNQTIRNLGDLGAVWHPPGGGETVTGRPILNLTFAVNYALGDLDVRGYHLVNLAIQVLAGLTLLGILRRTFLLPSMWRWTLGVNAGGQRAESGGGERTGEGAALGLALAGALLWTLHPLQTESVTYLSQRAESLMGLFYLLTMYAVIRGSQSRSPRIAVVWYAGAVAVCLLGMGTKEIMVSAPLCVLLYDRAFLAGSVRAAWRRRWGLYAALGSTWIWLGYLIYQSHGRGGTVGYELPIAWWQYLRNQVGAICLYLKLAVWPHPLVLDYLGYRLQGFGQVAPYAVVVAVLVAATVLALWRWPKIGFLGAWFWLILGPSSSVVPLVEQVEEHRMYLPLAAVVVGLVVGAYALWRRIGALRMRGGALVPLGAAAALAMVLGGLTYARNQTYQVDLSIWADTVRKRPDNPRALGNLVFALGAADQYGAAAVWARKAIAVQEGNAGTHYCLAWALSGMARQFQAENDPGRARQAYEQAIPEYRTAIELYKGARARVPGDYPDEYVEARFDLAAALAAVGRKAEAAEEYQRLIAFADLPGAHNGLGQTLEDGGHSREALEQFEKAVQLKPDYPEAQYNLGRLLWRLRRYGEALPHFEIALRLHPDDARMQYEVAWLLATSEGAPGAAASMALAAAQRACALTEGRNPLCLTALAAAYAAAGRLGEAPAVAEQALQLAQEQGQTQMAENIQAQLRQYRAGRPYRLVHFAETQTQPAEAR